MIEVIQGDALDVLIALDDAIVDAVVTDPPYGLGFMGKAWDRYTALDYERWCAEWATQCYRVLKPGGHLLAFGGTRTAHRLTAGIEDAGFEIRDQVTWMYGSGFPKSLDVSKAIDKAAGATRKIVGHKGGRYASPKQDFRGGAHHSGADTSKTALFDAITAPATPDAERWQGWGTALKPASEPIVVARKPLAGTVAATVTAHGTGALNIDGCRVAHGEPAGKPSTGMAGKRAGIMGTTVERHRETTAASTTGRWPTNVVLSHASTPDGGDACVDGCVDGCPVAELDAQSGERPGMAKTVLRRGVTTGRSIGGQSAYGTADPHDAPAGYGDTGGASRFFPVFRYQAKAPARERVKVDGVAHPTVKPLALMRWLCRLATPPGGVILDPFAGSGTTGEAAKAEGFGAVLIEREADYLPLIEARLAR